MIAPGGPDYLLFIDKKNVHKQHVISIYPISNGGLSFIIMSRMTGEKEKTTVYCLFIISRKETLHTGIQYAMRITWTKAKWSCPMSRLRALRAQNTYFVIQDLAICVVYDFSNTFWFIEPPIFMKKMNWKTEKKNYNQQIFRAHRVIESKTKRMKFNCLEMRQFSQPTQFCCEFQNLFMFLFLKKAFD